jgi:methionyl-tRNA formyltransferase
MNKPGIVFMGTPDFAVASLDAIVKAGYPVKAVITSPDKPSGRGLQMHQSPVKVYAIKRQLPVLQPLKLKDTGFLKTLSDIKPDLQVIVAFRMLPEEVWAMPRLGTFNLHASLLPQYRGAAPINWAIINGDTKTGVTTFFLNNEIDKGSILYQHEVPVGENDTAGTVHDVLMNIGAQLVVKTIADIASGNITPVEQNIMQSTEPLKAAPKIFKNDCRICWNEPALKIHNRIRGLSPYPAAWSEISGIKQENIALKIFKSTPVQRSHNLQPGTIATDVKHYLHVAVQDGFIQIDRLQLQAKKQMDIEDFLRGFPCVAEFHFV